MKHVGHYKAKIVSLGVEVSVLYFYGKCQYAQNEWLYISSKCHSILDLITFKILQEKKGIIIWFVLVYHLLSRGQSMTNCAGLKNPFIMLKVKHTCKKHWIDFPSWGKVKSMNELLKESIQNVVVINFIFVNADKVIAIDNTSWISLHLYVVQGWKQIPFFVFLEKVGV